MKYVYLDASLINDRKRGMGVYIEKLLENLPSLQGIRLIIFFSNRTSRDYLDSFCKGLVVRKVNFRAVRIAAPPVIVEQIVIPLMALFNRHSLIVSSGDTASFLIPKSRMILVLHDVYFLKDLDSIGVNCKSIKKRLGRFYRWLCISRFKARLMCKVITVSEFAKLDIMKELAIPPELICIVPNGVDLIDSSLLPPVRTGSILVTGNDPQKNLVFFLESFLRLPLELRSRLSPIRIVGVSDDAIEPKYHDLDFDFMGYLHHSEVVKLYSRSKYCFVPSLYESFGIPALEALAAGCRVAASSSGALPEVCREYAVYFSPQSYDEFVDAVNHLVSSKEVCSDDVSKHLAQYTWKAAGAKFGDTLMGVCE